MLLFICLSRALDAYSLWQNTGDWNDDGEPWFYFLSPTTGFWLPSESSLLDGISTSFLSFKPRSDFWLTLERSQSSFCLFDGMTGRVSSSIDLLIIYESTRLSIIFLSGFCISSGLSWDDWCLSLSIRFALLNVDGYPTWSISLLSTNPSFSRSRLLLDTLYWLVPSYWATNLGAAGLGCRISSGW